MFGILFRIEAKPDRLHELIDFFKWDQEVCNEKEPGTLRFEFYHDPENKNALYVYEAYRDLEAFEEHKKNKPYKRWSSSVQEELGTNFSVLFNGEAIG